MRGTATSRHRGRGRRPAGMHERFAARAGSRPTRRSRDPGRPRASGVGSAPALADDHPAHPEGLDRPEEVDGKVIEGTWRAHQVPLSGSSDNPEHLAVLERGCAPTGPRSCSTPTGAPSELVAPRTPDGDLTDVGDAVRQRRTPHDVPGPARLPRHGRSRSRCRPPGRRCSSPPASSASDDGDLRRNPTTSGCSARTRPTPTGWGGVRGVRPRVDGGSPADDEKLSRDGRVMEVLSEHNCHGWLEAYNLTGRHGLFATYEAFAMVSRP
jgi:xylulose-5-phosphate/fructose-6-phosphate phosphoketolase